MKKFSRSWIGSKNPRKQRKYRAQAPLHTRKDFVSAHLSQDLKKKYEKRSLPLRKGDKVKIVRGSFKKKDGKIERVDRKRSKVYITGVESVKKDGSKIMQGINPSKVVIVELNLEDKKRKAKLEKKTKK